MTSSRRKLLLTTLCSVIAVYHLVIVGQLPTWFGIFIPQQMHRAISVAGALLLCFLTVPASGAAQQDFEAGGDARAMPWYDYLLLASGLIGTGYVVVFIKDVLDYGLYGFLDLKGMIVAMALVVPLLEALRRMIGWPLPIIILSFVMITLFQPHMPGLLNGRGFGIDQVLYGAYVGDNGIFGVPLGVAANIIIVFVIFGALMKEAGASRWFMDISLALTGRSRGGPAKAAVVASGMFGSISGSPTADAASTGVFTIPLMIRVGYTPAFAAGCEAVASTGGMILPPVMGAIVFLMTEWIEVSYSSVVIAAVVPALLYYVSIFASVHFRAHKDDIAVLEADDLPRLWPAFKSGWFYLIPLVALVYMLVVASYPPGMAAIYTCGAVIVVSFLSRNREDWLTPAKIIVAFRQAVSRWFVVAIITASVGILIGSLELSGVGINISRFVVELAGGNFLLTLIFIGIACLIVGMGLDALPAYVTLATLFAPALIQLGVSPLQAHLYVIYWGLASFFTPPTCLAVFVTAGIARSNIWASGWEAVRLGMSAFLVPIIFVYDSGLLLMGSPGHVVLTVTTAFVGLVLLSAGLSGYLFTRLSVFERVLICVAALLLIAPNYLLAVAGLALAALACALAWYFDKGAAHRPAQ